MVNVQLCFIGRRVARSGNCQRIDVATSALSLQCNAIGVAERPQPRPYHLINLGARRSQIAWKLNTVVLPEGTLGTRVSCITFAALRVSCTSSRSCVTTASGPPPMSIKMHDCMCFQPCFTLNPLTISPAAFFSFFFSHESSQG